MNDTPVERTPRPMESGRAAQPTSENHLGTGVTGSDAGQGVESPEQLRRKLTEAHSAFAIALILLVAVITGAAIGYAAVVRHFQERIAEQHAAAQEAATEADTRWQSAQAEIEGLRIAAGRMESDFKSTQQTLEALRDRLGEIEDRFAAYRAESQSQIQSLREEKAALDGSVAELTGKNKSLDERLNAMGISNTALNAQVAKLTSENASLQGELLTADESISTLRQDLQTEVALKQSIKTRLEQEVASLNFQVHRLRGNLLMAHQRNDREQRALRRRLAAAEDQRKHLHLELEQVDAALKELYGKAAGISQSLAVLLEESSKSDANTPAVELTQTHPDKDHHTEPGGS